MSGDLAELLQDYGLQGEFLGAGITNEPPVLYGCRAQRNLALAHPVPLNVYLVGIAEGVV